MKILNCQQKLQMTEGNYFLIISTFFECFFASLMYYDDRRSNTRCYSKKTKVLGLVDIKSAIFFCEAKRNFHIFFFFACLSSIFSKFSPMHIPERHSPARGMFSLERITFCDAFCSYWKHFWQTWFQRQYKFHHGDFGQYFFTCGGTSFVTIYKTWDVKKNERCVPWYSTPILVK